MYLPMPKKSFWRALLTAFSLAVLFSGDALADENDRIRVGLVLGGGGARGAAHIGVLKELERLRIPVDAIAGTSMGAIVGALYASGMTADELEKLIEKLDWAAIMTDTPQRRELTYRRKQDDDQFPIDFEIGVRDGEFVLPKGVVQGQNLLLLLRELTNDVAHIRNYDDLPIPFRAVASDIERGEAHVMGAGDLALSIRASMSVPGLIAPARVDGKLLVDGGLVSNLPIDVMRTMDVDVLIAVDVEFPLYSPEELQSAPAITEQMLTVMTRRETLRQIDSLGATDILIRPELGTFASTNFAEIADTIVLGSDAAKKEQARLRELSVTPQDYANYMAHRQPSVSSAGQLAFVRIEHDGRMPTPLLASRLGVFAGDPIDSEVLADGANRLYGLDLYEQVSYSIIEENGLTGVEYRAESKSWGPDFLNLGLSVQDDFDGRTVFELTGRLTKAGLNSRGAEWRTDFQVGTNLGLHSEFYQPFGSGLKYFIAPRVDLSQENRNLFQLDQNIARTRVSNAEFGLDLGVELGMSGEFRFGAYRGTGETRVQVGDPLLQNSDFDSGAVFAQLRFDTLDVSRFPRDGMRANFRYDVMRSGLGADENFELFEADLLSVWSRGKNSLQLGLNYATTFGARDQVHKFFPLGGFLNLSGLNRGAISGPHAAMGRLVYYRQLSESTGGLFEVPMYFGASAEAGNVWQSRSAMSASSLLANGSVFLAFDTYLGAIYIAAGFAEGGDTNYYLSIGSPNR